MVRHICHACEEPFEAVRVDAKTCGAGCRQRLRRGDTAANRRAQRHAYLHGEVARTDADVHHARHLRAQARKHLQTFELLHSGQLDLVT